MNWVDISFDCLPLRSITRLDIPIDASPKYQAFCERVIAAIEKHGRLNSYYLHNAKCTFHLLNHAERGSLEFQFEGVVLTDSDDRQTDRCDLSVELLRETCDWLIEPAVTWFRETVPHSICCEFDRYIEAGDLDQAKQRIEQIQSESDNSGGFVGMYL